MDFIGAVKKNDVSLIKALINEGVNINGVLQDKNGVYPLYNHFGGNPALAEFLIKAGANVNI